MMTIVTDEIVLQFQSAMKTDTLYRHTNTIVKCNTLFAYLYNVFTQTGRKQAFRMQCRV